MPLLSAKEIPENIVSSVFVCSVQGMLTPGFCCLTKLMLPTGRSSQTMCLLSLHLKIRSSYIRLNL